jgi:hypothetical protein
MVKVDPAMADSAAATEARGDGGRPAGAAAWLPRYFDAGGKATRPYRPFAC